MLKPMKRMAAMLLSLLLLAGCGAKEAPAAPQEPALGSMPQRGITLPLTQEDVDAGIIMMAQVDQLDQAGECIIPSLYISYECQPFDEAFEKLDAAYESGELDDLDVLMEEIFAHMHTLAGIYLISSPEEMAVIEAIVEAENIDITNLGENDGYTYLLQRGECVAGPGDDPAVLTAMEERVTQLLQGITFQPVVLTEEDKVDLAGGPATEVSGGIPAFTTSDLAGNAADNSIFAQKDLTVLNIWAITCSPCIQELPELQAWSQTLPENVQVVGLLCDVKASDAAALGTAQAICEKTGVTYTNLLYCDDLHDFLVGIPFTPTTLFVDREGNIVGEPVIGANMEGYKAGVEAYLNGQ